MRRLTTCVLLIALAGPLFGQNLLSNPGFESGLSGWTTFGNAYPVSSAPPQFIPRAGGGAASLFGNFWGPGAFNVTGVFQTFPASPGDSFEMDVWTRHWSGDALGGSGAPNDNWVVAKMAFFDAGGTEIAGAEATVLDGTFATDVWHDATPFQGTAPAGTASVQALVLFLQPNNAGGACHVDDVSFTQLAGPPQGPVPSVALPSRINALGAFQVREVRPDGSLGPWADYEIRGIDVGWTPVGAYPWTANPPMLADPNFHDVLDELKAAGINTLRFYFLPGAGGGVFGAQTRATLDLCYQMGLKVLWALDQTLIGTPQATADLSASVAGFGDHPATLGFAIGNEWNLNLGHGGTLALAPDVQAIAAFLKSIDPARAVISSLACSPDNDLFRDSGGTTTASALVAATPDVDLWGMNIYRAGTFHPFFHSWSTQTNNKPYAIFEWGADSWNQVTGAVDYPQQATETAWHMDEAWRFAASQPSYAGTFVFAAVDEWWKNNLPGNSVWVQESDGFYTTPVYAPPSAGNLALRFRADADGHRSEEHFGILEVQGLVRKPVFDVVSDRFNNKTTPRADLDISLLSVGWLGNAGGLDNGYWALRMNGNDCWFREGGGDSRGLTIIEFDTTTGSVSRTTHFDTYDAVQSGTGAITAATGYLNGLPSGTLVGIAAADTMVHWNGNAAPYAPLFSAITARTGSTTIGSVGFRDGFSLLGYLDAPAPLAEGVPVSGAVVTASATVVLDLDGDGLGDDVDPDLDGDGYSDSWETSRGTDPVRAAAQMLTHGMSMNAARTLTITVLSGDAGGSYLDVDYQSLRFELVAPFQVDVTPILYTDFAIAVDGSGGVTLTSFSPVPQIPGGRLVLRFLDTSGRLYSSSVRID